MKRILNPVNPDDKILFLNRGAIYLLIEKNQEALADFNKALQINSQDAVAYYYRSIGYKRLNKMSQAMEDALQAKALGYPNIDHYVEELTNLTNMKANVILSPSK